MKDPLLVNYSFFDSPFGPIGASRPPAPRSTISTSESGQELWPIGVKLGIVRLGNAAGKLKYTLVDEEDIVLAREYTFEARLEVDIRGKTGAVVFAYAILRRNDPASVVLVQDLIWRRHNGPIPERKRVVHRNHISMDNRLDNLCLIDIQNAHVWYTKANVVKTTSIDIPPQRQVPQNRSQPRPPVPHQQPPPNLNNSAMVAADAAVLAAAAAAIDAVDGVGVDGDHFDDNQSGGNKSVANDLQHTLYWAAIQQLPQEAANNVTANDNGGRNFENPEQASSSSESSNFSSSSSSSWSSSSSSSSSSSNTSTDGGNNHHNNNINSQVNSSITATSNATSSSVSLYSHTTNKHPKCYDADGNLLNNDQGKYVYYECHHPPCVHIEREPREFSICGRCQETRYCGTNCQQLDWPRHKRHCRNKYSTTTSIRMARVSSIPYRYGSSGSQSRSSSSSSSSSSSLASSSTNDQNHHHLFHHHSHLSYNYHHQNIHSSQLFGRRDY